MIPHGEYYANGTKPRPSLRGVFHEIAAYLIVPTCAYFLLFACQTVQCLSAQSIFVASVWLCFFVSSQYHRRELTIVKEIRWNQWDHAGIFIMLAGCYTPLPLLALGWIGKVFVLTVWSISLAGVWWSFQLPRNRLVGFLIPVATGSLVLAIAPFLYHIYTIYELAAHIVGLCVYLLGGACYVLRWPNPWPQHFGYHEIWHLCTIGGTFCVFMVNHSIAERYA